MKNASRELDDLTLARARRGEDAAFRAVVERYQRPVFALVSRMLGRGPHVEDVAQETFLRVFRALPEFQPAGLARLSTWILTIATNLCLDELRRAKRRPVEVGAECAEPSAKEAADDATRRRMLGAAIERAVRALPPERHAVFVLRTYHELSYDEIATVLTVDVGTVKSRLSRAKSELRLALEDDHVD